MPGGTYGGIYPEGYCYIFGLPSGGYIGYIPYGYDCYPIGGY